MSFVSNDRDTIESFARHLGVPAKPGPDGSYAFRFAEDGTLTIAAAAGGERVCMTLESGPPHRDDARLKALFEAGYDPALGMLVHASGAADGALLFTVALEGGRLSLPEIENGLHALMAKARG